MVSERAVGNRLKYSVLDFACNAIHERRATNMLIILLFLIFALLGRHSIGIRVQDLPCKTNVILGWRFTNMLIFAVRIVEQD